ncbi:hypothetical protein AB204_09055 [Xenorhabdus khoisanae]|uniref:Uncharacterized protein n=1 Tax=Xenorhabdus khoisanae TaxID=880157 RepID=A0A0J5FT62_9GAMM|nr:hypothetical protein [Xenorhabdus khoisanae]KMJ45456.1 hypothetical protein AB204_09055 [Xenorhabdus khoisanae]
MNTRNMIALKGTRNAGKTKTLNSLIEKLESSNNFEQIYKHGSVDTIVVFVVKNIKVGISTGGDDESIVEERVGKLIECGCDIIVSATKTWGKTLDILNKLAGKHNYSVEEVDKSCADKNDCNDQSIKNELDAEKIFNRINEIING